MPTWLVVVASTASGAWWACSVFMSGPSLLLLWVCGITPVGLACWGFCCWCLGLGNMRAALSGGSLLSPWVLRWFLDLGRASGLDVLLVTFGAILGGPGIGVG